MKKLILLAIILFLQNIVSAQNYKCVSENDIRFFTNSNHYLRAIRIDSVKQINGNTVLYPFKTARGPARSPSNYAYKPGGSWLGKEIIIKADGTHFFINYNSDTVTIKSMAGLNDSWVLYNDTSSIYYTATVTLIDTMTVKGTVDSIKTITLSAWDANGVVLSHFFNNRKIVISKTHGFVEVFDLFVFPQQINGINIDDYFSDKAGAIDFKIIDFKNPDKFEIYDFQIGDVFQRKEYTGRQYRESYIFDSVMKRDVINTGHIRYTIRSASVNYLKYGPPGSKDVFIDTITTDIHSGPLLDMKYLPEEWGCREFIRFNPADTAFCFKGKGYISVLNYVYYYGDTTASVNTFEPCGGPNYVYKTGLGELNYSYCYDPTGIPEYRYMTYTKKTNLPCGILYPMIIPNTPATENGIVKLYPNPASDYLTIVIQDNTQPVTMIISEISGKVLIEGQLDEGTTNLSVRELTNGYYFLQLIYADDSKTTHKIVVAR